MLERYDQYIATTEPAAAVSHNTLDANGPKIYKSAIIWFFI
jgi:hypothetical protein